MLTDGAKSTGDNSNEEEGDISCEVCIWLDI